MPHLLGAAAAPLLRIGRPRALGVVLAHEPPAGAVRRPLRVRALRDRAAAVAAPWRGAARPLPGNARRALPRRGGRPAAHGAPAAAPNPRGRAAPRGGLRARP